MSLGISSKINSPCPSFLGGEFVRQFRSTHSQGKCDAMAQGGRSRTRAARHRQGVGSRWSSRVARATAASSTSAATRYHQGQQQPGRKRDEHSAQSGLPPVPGRPSQRRQNHGKHQQVAAPWQKRWNPRKRSRSWRTYGGCGRRDADRDIRRRTPHRYRVRRNRAGGFRGSPCTGEGHRPGQSFFTGYT